MKRIISFVICLTMILASLSALASCGNTTGDPVDKPEKTYYSVAVDGGTGAGKYYEGNICQVTAVVPEGKQFMKWLKNGQEVSVNETYAFEVTENSRLVAVFADAVANADKKVYLVETFSDGDKIVCKYDNRFDIIFMDVEMKFMDGISAAEEIRRVDSEVVIIFITNMMQYAIQGYAVQAFNYLLKPVSYFAFSHCLNKALSLRDNRKNKFALLNIKGGTARIDIKDIYFIETQGHVTICHVVNGEYQLTQTMREVESKLCDSHFFRISKGYLINLAYVENFDNNEVKIGKFTLPVSRTRKKDFFKALMTYWGGGS